jgi:predicted enzyme related to lactoylglutathione lyase
VLNEAEIAAGGVLVYLNVNRRIRDAVRKVVPNGGSVVQDTHSIGPPGFRAIVLDSEGNRIALHSVVDA